LNRKFDNFMFFLWIRDMDSHVLVWLSACPFVLVFLSMEGAFIVSTIFFLAWDFVSIA